MMRTPNEPNRRVRLAAAVVAVAALALLPVAPAVAQAPPAPPISLVMGAQAESSTPQEEAQQLELSLLQAVETALRHNLQVRINSLSPDLQEESITAARARFDPSIRFDVPASFSRNISQGTNQLSGADVLTSDGVSGGFSFTHSLEYGTNWSISWNASRNETNNAFSTFNPRYNSSVNLRVDQPLLRNFGREINRQQIVVAQHGYESSQEQFRQQVQTIVFQVYQAYWELVFAERDLEVTRLSLDLAEQQLARNRIQVEIGTLAPIETIQAEQQVASRQLQLTQAEVAIQDREDDLKRLLNIDQVEGLRWEVDIVPTDEPAVSTEDVDVEEAISIALESDPTLRQQRINLRTRELNLRVARNAMLPDVAFTGSINLSGQGGDRLISSGFGSAAVIEVQEGGFSDALQNLLSGDFRNWSIGLSVSFPINNWGARAQHAQAAINERSSRLQIADREQQVRVDVMKAARQVQSGAQQVAQSRTARDLAERQLDAEQRKFAVGSATNFQVLEFQRQLADARSSELRSIINFTNSLARLEQAKGTLLESLGVNIDMAAVPGGTYRR